MAVDLAAEALKFFDQLEEFSRRYVRAELGLYTATSPWGGWEYKTHEPRGAIIHYTVDEDLVRVLRWFLDEQYQARVSAHVVVADRRLSSHDQLAFDLPLVQELPVTVVQTRQPDTRAWHATWANGITYGIENVNAGPLKMMCPPQTDSPGEFHSWQRQGRGIKGTDPWRPPHKAAVRINNGWWSPYPAKQVKANIILLRYLQQLYGSLKRSWILGHEQVQRNKRDPGPAFPLQGIRDSIYDGWTPMRRYDWYRLYEVDHLYGQTEQDHTVIEYARKAGGAASDVSPVMAWMHFSRDIRALPDQAGVFGYAGRAALRLLGYHVTDLTEGELDADELMTVRIFQKMMGLITDSCPGRKTKTALVERLEERNMLLPISENT